MQLLARLLSTASRMPLHVTTGEHSCWVAGEPAEYIDSGNCLLEGNRETTIDFVDVNWHSRQTGAGKPADQAINARERRRGPARLPGHSFRK